MMNNKFCAVALSILALSFSAGFSSAQTWDKSSLSFQAGCSSQGNVLQATVCNVGSAMQGTTTWQLLYSPSGNPKNGTIVASGQINMLAAGQCTILSSQQSAAGNYMFKAFQRPGHPGAGVAYSDQCSSSSSTTTSSSQSTTTTSVKPTTSSSTSTSSIGGGEGSVPNPPSGLTLTVISCSSIKLQWVDNSSDEDGFKIERATSAGGPFTQIATVGPNVTQYTAAGLSGNTAYYFRVRAYKGATNSSYTTVKNATTTSCAAWDKSSLSVQAGCIVDGSTISATVCNSGTGNMTGTTNWELYYAPSGNAKTGSVVCSGTLGPLNSGQCTTVSCSQTAAGNYIFKFYQMPGHPGTGVAWSQQCSKGTTTTTTTTSSVVTGGGAQTTTSTCNTGGDH